MADRRNVAGPVPGGTNAVHAGECRHVSGRREAAHLADVHADKVDQPVLDERRPLSRVVEEFPHRDGRGALLPDVSEPLQVFRRERVLQEEQLEGFRVFRELDRVHRNEPFVNVVEEFDVRGRIRADVADHVEDPPRVFPRVVAGPFLSPFRAAHAGRSASVASHLNANVLITLFLEFQDVVQDFVFLQAVGVRVTGRCFTAFAAQKLVDGHPRAFALDVPQRDIHAGDRVVEYGTVAPVPVDHGHLPDVFDAVDVASDEKRFQVFFEGGMYGVKSLRKRGAAETVETGLRREDFDHDEA